MREYKILGIKFFDCSTSEFFEQVKEGGVVVVPAAPSFMNILTDKSYYRSLKESDFAIFDSGLLCLLLFFVKGFRVNKFSGLKLINIILDNISKYEKVFLIDPTKEESKANRKLIATYGRKISGEDQYVAPNYGGISCDDENLYKAVIFKRPDLIIINLGGGIQEKVAYYLYKKIKLNNRETGEAYKPLIICTGAAIAFKTGNQVKIPHFIDCIYMGWLWRCLSDPGKYISRYFRAFSLVGLVIKKRRMIESR